MEVWVVDLVRAFGRAVAGLRVLISDVHTREAALLAYSKGFVQVSVEAIGRKQRDVQVHDVAVLNRPRIGDAVANDLRGIMMINEEMDAGWR